LSHAQQLHLFEDSVVVAFLAFPHYPAESGGEQVERLPLVHFFEGDDFRPALDMRNQIYQSIDLIAQIGLPKRRTEGGVEPNKENGTIETGKASVVAVEMRDGKFERPLRGSSSHPQQRLWVEMDEIRSGEIQIFVGENETYFLRQIKYPGNPRPTVALPRLIQLIARFPLFLGGFCGAHAHA
jgi:hypothetical protein